QGDGLTAVGTDLLGDLLALLDSARTKRHRKAVRGKLDGGGRADTRRRAGDDRGSAGGKGVEAGHLLGLHGVGKMCEPSHTAGMDTYGVGFVHLVAADAVEQFI